MGRPIPAERAAKGLNWKQVAIEAGVSQSTLTRMSKGKRPDVDGLAALASWSGLAVVLDEFVNSRARWAAGYARTREP